MRIYFGASAGVGKTFAMLAAARQLRDAGTEVVAGVVETHGRRETEALLDGIEVLPRRTATVNGRSMNEFDLDAALARQPSLLLVDELAHTNLAGSRHSKRWQDVEELLAAGIDVYTTLNVQHLESLNDVVGGITGIRVWETIPDTFFDTADEVLVVDIPADELLARLAAGKVYVPEQIEHAAKNFFRKGNLMALRELALRRTADRIEDDVQAYRVKQAIRARMEDRSFPALRRGSATGGGRGDKERRPPGVATWRGLDGRLCGDATAATTSRPGPGRDSADIEAGAGHGGPHRRALRGGPGCGAGRLRSLAQLLEIGTGPDAGQNRGCPSCHR